MKFFKSWPVQLILFLMGFLVLNGAFEFFLLEPNRETTVIMYDMKKAENVDIAFTGSSISERHVDNAVMEETLGMDSFNLTTSQVHSAATCAMVEELYCHHSPQVVVWLYDPTVGTEPLVVEAGLWPHLSSWINRWTYAWRTAQEDGAYLDRFFPWRQTIPVGLDKLRDIYNIKTDLVSYHDQSVELYRADGENTEHDYDEKGYRPIRCGEDNPRYHNEQTSKVAAPKGLDLAAEEISFQKLKSLCEDHGSQFIVASAPIIPHILLGNKEITYLMGNMERLCEENDVPYLDMARAKPELIRDDLTPYFYNGYHMTRDGAERFSQGLATALKSLLDGQDVSHYFYTEEEYAQSKNYILNGWYTESKKDGKITYAADCIYGADVEPQYQFSVVDEAGNETILRPYRRGQKFTCDAAQLEGKTICIKIRNAADLEQEIVTAIKK